jgi:uncharacterized protein YbbK (DUF523 family)
MKIVSACLAGVNCRYDGKSNTVDYVVDLVKRQEAIPVCLEQLGGLTTPRKPAEIINGKVCTAEAVDLTDQFTRGANEALNIAKLAGCKEAILKAKSPSCGYGRIYNGTYSGTLTKGDGLFAKLLSDNGIDIKTEEDL